MAKRSYESIYGEIIPDRIDKGETETVKQYPAELIISFDSVGSPSLAELTRVVRDYVIGCNSSAVKPIVVLNFCITDHGKSTPYIYFLSIAEYINDIKSSFESIEFYVNCRGLFSSHMNLLIVAARSLSAPITLSRHTRYTTFTCSDETAVLLELPATKLTEEYLTENNLLIRKQ